MELITELIGWIISSTEIMSSNTIGPLPKKSDNPSENIRRKGGIWMTPKRNWSLLLAWLSKKGILSWLKKCKTKANLVKESITTPISSKKKIDTVKKQINHKHPMKQ